MKSFKIQMISWMSAAILAGTLVACDSGGGGGGGNNNAATPAAPTTPGTPLPGAYSFGGTLNISNKSLYRDFLFDFGAFCDQALLWNFGYSNCNTWDNSAFIELFIYGDSLPATGQVVIYAYPENYYSYYDPGYPIYLNGVFEVAGDDPDTFIFTVAGYNGLRIEVDQINTTLRVDVFYQGTRFGNGSASYYDYFY